MPKVEVVHLASPVCQWSWGYEAVMNRLALVYGDQVTLTLAQALPYTDREQWLEEYEMTREEATEFNREIAEAAGLPVRVAEWSEWPRSTLPAAIAVKAAGLVHGPREERRLHRALLHAFFVEGRDTGDEAVLADVVRAAGLDLDAMVKAADGDDATRALEEDMAKAGHGGNFYSLIVRDGEGTTVTLERAYDPARVERAVEFVAGRKLRRREPRDVVGYVREHGPVSLGEVRRVFALSASEAREALSEAERRGKLRTVQYDSLVQGTAADRRFWAPA